MKNGENKIYKNSNKTKKKDEVEENLINEINYHKLQLENAKKECEIIKLREEIQQFKKGGFDTSSSFPWPTEFKNRWETFVHTMIMDNFDTINTNYILLTRTLNIIVKLIYDISNSQIRQKTIELLKCLGLQNISDINISNFYNKFQRLLFQDFFKTLFNVSNEFYNSILAKIKSEIYNNKTLFNQKDIEEIFKDLNNENITNFIREIYFLCLYMNINEPKLVINTSTDIDYRYYNKDEYDIIEGFPKNNDICIIILNPPMIGNNKPFKGIKPAVFIMENPSKEIRDICNKQKDNKYIYNSIIQISNTESRKKLINNKNEKDEINKNIKNSNDNENDLLNSNNSKKISIEIKRIIPSHYMTINYKHNNSNYKEKEELIQQNNFSKTINKEEILKMKNSPDYFLKKHIINPINIQKYKENKEKIVQKNLRDKLKNAHFINPQKILNINTNQKKMISNNANEILNEIKIERNNSIENNNNKYTFTETNINMSTPLTYSILDTASNMINLFTMKKKLGLLLYSNNKTKSPSMISQKNDTNREKRRIKPIQINNILNKINIEKNNNNKEVKNNKNKYFKKEYKSKEIEQEKINTEIKQRSKDFDISKKRKNHLLDSIKNNFKERLSYNENKKKVNINNLNENINNIINHDLVLNALLNNENDIIEGIDQKRFSQKSNNNLKNINNVFNINNNLKNNHNYNNSENNRSLESKYSLRRKINNSINISRQKDINSENININSINSTSNNNNININININNNNNGNGNNFRGNVILNYDDSSKIAKTETDIHKKTMEKSVKKLNTNKYLHKNSSKNKNKNNLNMRISTINPHMKALMNIKNENDSNIFETSSKYNNTISYKTNIRELKAINTQNYISPLTYNYMNNINKNDKKSLKNPHMHIILKNKSKNNITSLNNDRFKNNKYKNLYNKSEINFINNKKISNEKIYFKSKGSNNKNKIQRDKKLKQKSISFEPKSQYNNYSLEKSQENKIYLNYNNTLINSKMNNNSNDIKIDNLNKSINSIKKYSKNKKKNQNISNKNYISKNKNYFISLAQNTKNKRKKQCKIIKSDINLNSLKKNRNSSKKSEEKISHNKISSDGLKINFERNNYNIIKTMNYYSDKNY